MSAGRSGGGSATTPHPPRASSPRRSRAPGGGFTTTSGTTATRRDLPSPRIAHPPVLQDRVEGGELRGLVVVEQVLADADGADVEEHPRELVEQRLGEDACPERDGIVLVARLVGTPAPLLARGGQLDAHAGAAVDPDDDHPGAG